ncbi:MAG: proton-conducting transporter membrane subunit [Halobacteria archaeon]|nr:proton-conducting transporter membrane subunit [Halobacteria archaeon]
MPTDPVNHIAVAPVLVPLVTGVVALLLRNRRRARIGVSMAGGVLTLLASFGVALEARNQVLVYHLGGYLVDGVPYGILLEVDALSGFMMAFSSFVMLVSLVYALESVAERAQRVSFHGLWHIMTAGVMGAFSTGDLFNLFVWFEVMLMSSYVLVVLYSGSESTRSGFYYIAVNLVGSALMLISIGGVYAVVGTLNMADIARRVSQPGFESAPLYGVAALLLVAFLLKAGVAPFHFWVPEVYPASPTPVASALAGVVKKVGVYGMIRVFGTVLVPLGGFYSDVILGLGLVSAVYGGWAAVSRDTLLDVLSYSSVAQVGLILVGVGIGIDPDLSPGVRALGVTAALVYSLNHAVLKSLLFLAAGRLSESLATTRLESLGGLSRKAPVVSYSFFVGAVALVGIPPLNGFFGKLLVFDSGVRADSAVVVAGSLLASVLTVVYLSRAWTEAFWGETSEVAETYPGDRLGNYVGIAPIVVLVITAVLIGLFFDPVLGYAETAAHAALDTSSYVDAALPENATGSGVGAAAKQVGNITATVISGLVPWSEGGK